MTTPKLTTAQVLYRTLTLDDRYSAVSYIANVLFTSCGKKTSRLKALKALVDAGREVGTITFQMPYECLSLDGRAVVAMPLLDRGEEIPYGPDWYKH